MKRLILFSLVYSVYLLMLSCTSYTGCKEMQHKEILILMDISDPRLFKEIKEDLTANFPGFMARNNLGSINNCQSLTLSIAHLSGMQALDLSSASISITRKGLSKMEQRNQASPAPLVELMKKKMIDYEILSNTPEMTGESNISSVIMKSIYHLDQNAESVILVFSDMMENNRAINFYKGIPSGGEVTSVLNSMIDPILMEQFHRMREQGIDTKIIIVQKPEPSGKSQLRDVKEFWGAFFKELKLDGQLQFIDNLTNPVQL